MPPETNNLEQYISLLNPEQKAAVQHEGSPLLILAGAGSGKTRVITTKIAYLISEKNIDPYQILSVTFTKKAANEMKERAVSIEPRAEQSQIRTFHSFGSWFLRKFNEYAGLEQSFTVYDDSDMETLVKKAYPGLSTKEAKTAAKQISLAKDYCLSPEDDLSIIGSEFDLNEIYSAYQKRLRATGNADFGDLIMLPVKIMEANPEVANYIHNRFKVIMVDEYQDSNIAQYKLLQKLSGVEEGCNTYVCVVGDDDQSIYKFRGAEVQNILSFPEKFPGTEIIRLERNYRSTAKILAAASMVVKHNANRLDKTLIADRGEGGKPVLAYLGDQSLEASFCGDLILKSVKSGAAYSDWAVLYRTNAQSVNFENEFIRRKIPYEIVGSLKFYEREEIKDALSYLALCANPRDELSFRRVVNKPARAIGEKTQDKILEASLVTQLITDEETGEQQQVTTYSNLIETCKTMAASLSKKASEGVNNFVNIYETVTACFNPEKKLSDFIERVINDSGLGEYFKEEDKIEHTYRFENLQELINQGVAYACTVEGLTAFLDSINLDRALDLQNEMENGDSTDKVTLITLHNTKGLEYNRVIITGLEEGVFPRQDKTGIDLEEERRLFYVGITRAKNELYVTSTAKRCLYGAWQYMRPSKFLSEAQGAFTVIGKAPSVYGYGGGYGSYGGYGSAYGSTYGKNSGFGSDANFGDKSYLAEKWKKGTKVYHDDYGYGIIASAYINEGEYVIEIQFENQSKKKFLPEYQSKSIEIIKD